MKPAALLRICGGSDSEGKLSTTLATLSLMSLAALSKFILVSNAIFPSATIIFKLDSKHQISSAIYKKKWDKY